MAASTNPLWRAAVAAGLFAACSPPNLASTDVGVACADYAYALCSRLAACSPTDMERRFPTPSTCIELQTASCSGAIPPPGDTWSLATPGDEEACANAISSGAWACGDFLGGINIPSACQFLMGTAPAGHPCAYASQCQTGYCELTVDTLCGTCAPVPTPGSPCGTLANCGRGFACESGVCVALVGNGQPCDTTHVCIEGFGCSSGTCQPAVGQLGATCVPGGTACDLTSALACNSVSKTCQPLQISGDNGPCGTVAGQYTPCGAGDDCVDSVCRHAANVGEACNLDAGPGCVAPSRCVNGTCEVGSGSTCH